MIRLDLLAFVLALGLGVGLGGVASAQSPTPTKGKCGEDTGKGGANYEIVRGPDGRKIFKIKTGFCIEGKVPKPSVIYVLNASTINYEWETLKQDFLPKSVKAVEESPF